jgi:AcrR family transcriptional regulator
MGRHKKISDEKLIQCARECILKNGPQVSTAVIAHCAGVSQAAIFKRYATKQDLLIAALAPSAHPAWVDLVESGPDENPFKMQLANVVSLLNEHIEKILPRIHLLHVAGLDPRKIFQEKQSPPLVQGIKQLASWFRRAEKMGHTRKINANSIAITLLGAVQSRHFIKHLDWQNEIRSSRQTHLKTVVDVIWQGIAPGDNR